MQLQNKDPRGWQEFADQLAEHSTEGAALTMRGVQKRRPSLFELVDKMKTITAPTLIMTGDEDWPCLEPGVLMKKNIATAALVVMPNAGHNINLEEPAAFNAHLAELFHGAPDLPARLAANGMRDPRADGGLSISRAQVRGPRAGYEDHRVVAAVDQHVGAGHEARRVAREEQRGRGDLFRLAEPAEQMLRAGDTPRGLHVAEPRISRSVSTAPGESVLTRMFRAAWSIAIALASWMQRALRWRNRPRAAAPRRGRAAKRYG